MQFYIMYKLYFKNIDSEFQNIHSENIRTCERLCVSAVLCQELFTQLTNLVKMKYLQSVYKNHSN